MLKFDKKIIAICLAIIFFIGLDRFLKMAALADYGRQLNLIGEILKFNCQPNYYLAFSLPLAGKFLIALIGLIIVALSLWAADYLRRREYGGLWPLFLIIFGATSNLLDRIKYGYVVDYLDLKYFTVFNLADAMIVAGVIFYILILIKSNQYAGKN